MGWCIKMKNSDIKEIISKLDWNNDEKVQIEGRMLASKLTDLTPLIQPDADKWVWENCALVLNEKSDEELRLYLKGLLAWLQDLNWPGSMIILERLQKMEVNVLRPDFEETIYIAQRSKDMNWIDSLSILLENEKFRKQINPRILEIIKENEKELLKYE